MIGWPIEDEWPLGCFPKIRQTKPCSREYFPSYFITYGHWGYTN